MDRRSNRCCPRLERIPCRNIYVGEYCIYLMANLMGSLSLVPNTVEMTICAYTGNHREIGIIRHTDEGIEKLEFSNIKTEPEINHDYSRSSDSNPIAVNLHTFIQNKPLNRYHSKSVKQIEITRFQGSAYQRGASDLVGGWMEVFK